MEGNSCSTFRNNLVISSSRVEFCPQRCIDLCLDFHYSTHSGHEVQLQSSVSRNGVWTRRNVSCDKTSWTEVPVKWGHWTRGVPLAGTRCATKITWLLSWFLSGAVNFREVRIQKTAVWCGQVAAFKLFDFCALNSEPCASDDVYLNCLFSLSRSACSSLCRTYHLDSRKNIL